MKCIDSRIALRRFLPLAIALCAVHAACSSDGGNSTDRGVVADAGTTPKDADTANDAGGNPADAGRDAGPPRDTGVEDVGGPERFCAAEAGKIAVTTAVDVAVGEPTTTTLAGTNPGIFDCIDEIPTPFPFPGGIFIRGCFVPDGSGAVTDAELDALDFTVFRAWVDVARTEWTDPTWNRATGEERTPEAIITRAHVRRNVGTTACASGIEFDLGYDLRVGEVIQSEMEYVIRVRTATTSATWLPVYHHGVIVRSDSVFGSGGGHPDIQNCGTDSCYLRQNIYGVRRAAIAAAVGKSTIAGANDLDDGLGTGFGLIEARDCFGVALAHAVSGFEPRPLRAFYVGATGAFDANLVETSMRGEYLGLGFPGMTATTSVAMSVWGAVGINRDGASGCMEEYAGFRMPIYPDAITVYGSGVETTLHGN